MKKYLNFHTHRLGDANSVFYNLCEPHSEKVQSTCKGIHPWSLEEANWVSQIKNLPIGSQTLLMGEIGLDRLKGPSINIQMQALESQLQLAKTNDLACVLHNVRCSQELLELRNKKQYSSMRPWVIHDFQGPLQLAHDFLRKGFFISLSPRVMNTKHKLHDLVHEIDPKRVFLETDDADPELLFPLYEFYSERTELEMQSLIDLHWQSFEKLTGWSYERVLVEQSRVIGR